MVKIAYLSRFSEFNCRVRFNIKQPNRNECFSTQRFFWYSRFFFLLDHKLKF